MHARSKTIVVTSAVLGFLATFVVCLRFWARHLRLKNQRWGFDDALLLVSIALTIGVVATNCWAATWSRFGEHEILDEDGIPLQWQIDRQSITIYTVSILHTCAMPAIKAYTLAFYIRIFVSQGFRRVAYVIGAYILCWWISVLLGTILQCIPANPIVPVGAKCINVLGFLQAAAVLNVISDVAIVIMPIPMIAKLQMPLRHKLGVIGIFLTGTLVIIAGIGRTISYFDVPDDVDFSYHDYYLLIWTSIEPCMGVIGACLPSCRPLFQGFSPESLFGSIRSKFSSRPSSSRQNIFQAGNTAGDDASAKSSEMYRNRSSSNSEHLQQESYYISELEERPGVVEV